jgi:hypothetical protein
MPDTTRTDELLASIRRLPDDELVRRLKSLAARERRATVILVAHVAELDTRDVYLRAGYSSLFAYCCDVLALSEHEALNRIEAARTARRFPVVLELLAAAEINLTTVRLLGPHLTADNHVAVLASARGKRKAEVEEIVARLSPRPDVAASVRKLPEPKSAAPGGSVTDLSTGSGPTDSPVPPVPPAEAVPVPLPHARRSAEVTPLSPDRYRYQLTIGGPTLEKLRLAKDMLRHALPSGDDEAVLDRALTALLNELARRKLGAEPKEGSVPKEDPALERDLAPNRAGSADEAAEAGRAGSEDSRHVPVAVKRAVWVRDLGRCAFVGPDGHRCGERAFVEFHHVRPCAVGGEPTVENIHLRCRRHNGYEARAFFAREPVDEGQVRGAARRAPGVSGASGSSTRTRSGTGSGDRPDRSAEGRGKPRSGAAGSDRGVVPSAAAPV